MITVRQALALPSLRRGLPEVVAGEQALDRPVRWVHAGEVPNIAELLRGGEILLTTGMGIGTRAADQRRFVSDLAERGIAALVIELGERYEGGLPKALIRAAEQHGLPLIVLHATVPFVGVTEAIHTAIVGGRVDELRRVDELQERFTAVMLDGGGVQGVLAELAEALGNPVFLEAADGRLLAHAAPPGAQANPLAAWADAAADAETVGATTPVPGEHGTAGRLASLPLERPLEPFAAAALHRAAGVVALALLRSRQEEELLAAGRGDFLAKLAAGGMGATTAAARAKELGFRPRKLAALLPLVVRRAGAEVSWTSALGDVERALTKVGVPVLVGVDEKRGRLLVLAALRDAADREDVAGRLAALVRATALKRLDADVVVAAGPAAPWGQAGAALNDTAETADAAAGLPPREWHDALAMPLDRLLYRLRDDAELQRYVDRLLQPVLDHDATRRHPLLPTLDALTAHGGRKAETARALHLNRQALYDRVARLETLLQADLSDSETLLALHLAVRAHRTRHNVQPRTD